MTIVFSLVAAFVTAVVRVFGAGGVKGVIAENSERVHQSHDGQTPNQVGDIPTPLLAKLQDFSWKSTCNGLVELPKAA